ncbi:hypothetical protein GCM10010446_24350 [Streptomyces enissocaesilis]|uniref:Penicillin amidase n=1 Tax=Streptomyces enissocaesilis TaxID=332589 RepID=A0ABP6JMD3_9ACTN
MHFRTRLKQLTLTGIALVTAAAVLPPATAGATSGTADAGSRDRHPSSGKLSALIRYTEYGIPHIVAKDYANLGFGTGWAQAADQVCTLADGFVTVRGERSRHFGPDAAPDSSLSSATRNLSSDLYFAGVRDAGTVEKLLATPAPAGPSRQVGDSMRGWAAGYNAWLKQNRITDPACKDADWVRPVTPLDVARRGFAVSVLGGQGRGIDGITPQRRRAPGRRAPGTRAPRLWTRSIRSGRPVRRARCSLRRTPTWGPTASRSAGGPPRTGADCCWAIRTTPGRAAGASGSRSRPYRAN